MFAFAPRVKSATDQPHTGAGASGGPLRLSRPGDAAEIEADRAADRVLRTWEAAGMRDHAPASAQAAAAVATYGAPIPPRIRAPFERGFDWDFSRVRVHDGAAAEWAQELSARAYTFGNHLVFGGGQYASDTARGARISGRDQFRQQPAGVVERSPARRRRRAAEAAEGALQGGTAGTEDTRGRSSEGQGFTSAGTCR
jgi:hypothetical protein